MKTRFWSVLTFVALFCLAAGSGCNRHSAPPTPLTAEELPGVMEKAFASAKPEAKQLATQIAAAVQGKDYPKAFQGIQNLATVQGLNKEQVQIAARATLTINSLLQTAQSQGDAKAAATLKKYHDTK